VTAREPASPPRSAGERAESNTPRATRELADAAARERIRTDLGTTLFVEAAAGTGKTTALVQRMLAVIRTGAAQLSRMVAMTFTENAAGELKLRLRTDLEQARRETEDPAERARLEQAMGALETAQVNTIHGFCADVVREWPVEAGVDPLFEVAAPPGADALLHRALDDWLEQVLERPPEGVRRLLRRPSGGAGSPRQQLWSAARAVAAHRDFPAPWRREQGFAREAEIDAIVAGMQDLAALREQALEPGSYLARALGQMGDFCGDVALQEAAHGRDYDWLEQQLRATTREYHRKKMWSRKKSPRQFSKALNRYEVVGRRDRLRARLDAFLCEADADLAACLHQELFQVVEAYQRLKGRAGQVDFLDLLLLARDLVRDHAHVRAALQGRFTHLFVDEFQDTDPLQAELILLLASSKPRQTDWRRVHVVPGKLFLVGDPKQAIYRFRRADVAIYQRVKQQLVKAREAEVVHLQCSFRMVPGIQDVVNAAFRPLMKPGADNVQADYVDLEHVRERLPGQPAVVALPVPRPLGAYGVTAGAMEESQPAAVAAFVHWLVSDSGWQVTERGTDGPVPLCARHVCLLFRRMSSWSGSVAQPYLHELELRDLPHLVVGGSDYHGRDEVIALRNALCAVEWPDDRLRTWAALRGPLFGIPDELLLRYCEAGCSLHTRAPRDREAIDPELWPVADGLDLLGRLHGGRNRRPVAATITELLQALRAHAALALWPDAEQALSNLRKLVEDARCFETAGGLSFRAFVEELEVAAAAGESDAAPAIEEDADGVRLMTVHKAKGLEFPVVILADLAGALVHANPTRHVDADRQLWAEPLAGCVPHDLRDHEAQEKKRDKCEAERLTYVAATRARDLLVVPVTGSRPATDRWCSPLNGAVYPAPGNWDRPRDASSVGCPRFAGKVSVLDLEEGVSCVQPGLHRGGQGGADVVWWDPAALDLDVAPSGGSAQRLVLEIEREGDVGAGAAVNPVTEEQRAWAERLRADIEGAATPSIRSVSVTAHAAARAEAGERTGVEVQVHRVEAGLAARPGGRRFGSLVHAILERVPFDADRETVERVALLQARSFAAPDEEREAAVALVGAALQHPVMREVAALPAEDVYREVSLSVVLEDGTVLEGIADLVARTGEGWWVVDYKVTAAIERELEVYREQVGAYVGVLGGGRGALLVV